MPGRVILRCALGGHERLRNCVASIAVLAVVAMGVASSFGFALLRAGLACFVHAVFPFLFTATARDAIEDLHRRIVTHRDRRTHA